jgi:GNAT superfamily N-acetyltransferase
MQIRKLDPIADRNLVEAFFVEIADYVRLERDESPTPIVTEEFFTEAPPGCEPEASFRLGAFAENRLIAIAEMALGYPAATDAYIGFLAVTEAARGKGAGRDLLRHLEELARDSAATRIFLAVLDANPRGRAFWEREGFSLALPNREVTLGQKTQIAHRLGKAL